MFGFPLLAGIVDGSVTFAVTDSFGQALILAIVSGTLVAVGQVVTAIITNRESEAHRKSIEENREILRDIQASANLNKRRNDASAQ